MAEPVTTPNLNPNLWRSLEDAHEQLDSQSTRKQMSRLVPSLSSQDLASLHLNPGQELGARNIDQLFSFYPSILTKVRNGRNLSAQEVVSLEILRQAYAKLFPSDLPRDK